MASGLMYLAPELLLCVTLVLVLLFRPLLPAYQRRRLGWLSLTGVALALLAACLLLRWGYLALESPPLVFDEVGQASRLLLLAVLAAALLVPGRAGDGQPGQPGLLAVTLLTAVLIAARDLTVWFLSVELLALLAWQRLGSRQPTGVVLGCLVSGVGMGVVAAWQLGFLGTSEAMALTRACELTGAGPEGVMSALLVLGLAPLYLVPVLAERGPGAPVGGAVVANVLPLAATACLMQCLLGLTRDAAGGHQPGYWPIGIAALGLFVIAANLASLLRRPARRGLVPAGVAHGGYLLVAVLLYQVGASPRVLSEGPYLWGYLPLTGVLVGLSWFWLRLRPRDATGSRPASPLE